MRGNGGRKSMGSEGKCWKSRRNEGKLWEMRRLELKRTEGKEGT